MVFLDSPDRLPGVVYLAPENPMAPAADLTHAPMSTDPQSLAVWYVQSKPGATETEAVSFASELYPKSWYSVALFLHEWMRLRKCPNRKANAVGLPGNSS
jgi:hypothetical protein